MVKVGYLLPTRENILLGQHSGRALLDAAKYAHGLGYDSVWAGDSLTARPRHDPLTLLAGVAGAISDIEIGTAVLLPALRNPVVLAQQLATIDQLSEGRLIVGAGLGANSEASRIEFAAAGVPFAKRLGRMNESFRLIRTLWRGEPVTWQGRWQVDNCTLAPQPYQADGPPIWLGTTVDAGLIRAGKHYDGWFPIGPDPKAIAERRQVFVNAALEAGRDAESMTTAMYTTVALNENAEQASHDIDSYLESYYGVPAHLMRAIQACIGGSIEAVMAELRRYVDAGVQHFVLRIVGDHRSSLKQIADYRHLLEK